MKLPLLNVYARTLRVLTKSVVQPSLANSMSFGWALCADKYTATLTSCAYCYLSTEEEKDAENGTKRCI